MYCILTPSTEPTISGKNVTVTNDAFDMLAAETYDVEFANVGNADFVLTFNANTSSNAVDANYKDGTYTSAGYGAYVYSSGGTINLNGGTFNCTSDKGFIFNSGFDVNNYGKYYKSRYGRFL